MSKTIQETKILTTYPSEFISGNYSSISNQTSPIGQSSSSTSYATITCSTGSKAQTYAFWAFNCSKIPSQAIINSVSCVAKCYVSSTSRITTRSVQLYVGTSTAKGSSVSFSNSTSETQTLNCGTWSRQELNNCYIRIGGIRSSSQTSQNTVIRFYGATLTINYTYEETVYEVTSSLATDNIESIEPEGLSNVSSGENYILSINASNIDNIEVLDNNINVTNQLVQHEVEKQSILSQTANSYIKEGIQNNSQYASYPVGYSAENPHIYSSNMYASNNSTGYAEYSFDFSEIPNNTIIESIEIKCSGKRESSTVSTYYKAEISLYSGSTLKGEAQEFTSTSQQIITIENPGTWTREELQNAKLRFTVGYYGGQLYGITWNVTYSINTTSNYYWTYTLNSVNADHTIIIQDSIIEIPDEDPQYNYYPITISSINATTIPRRGTTRIIEGSNQTITIYPSEQRITLITDNGQDVSSQLINHAGVSPTYNVSNITTQYTFNLNNSTGYYTSNNQGISSSAAVARVNFNLPVKCLVTFTFINYAEETYDFGVFSKLDTALSTNSWTAGSSSGDTTTDAGLEQLRLNTSSYNKSSTQTLTYEIPAGEHFIDVKYAKDQGTDSGNDSLQFKISDIQELEPNQYYTYTLSNIQESHSLIFIFGDVTYYFINSSGNGCKLYPNGSIVQLPEDTYKITIVPDSYDYNISLKDNGISQVIQKKESEITKDGKTIKVINYIYTIDNIQETHNIVIQGSKSSKISNFKIKIDNNWKEVNESYFKLNNNIIKINFHI